MREGANCAALRHRLVSSFLGSSWSSLSKLAVWVGICFSGTLIESAVSHVEASLSLLPHRKIKRIMEKGSGAGLGYHGLMIDDARRGPFDQKRGND